MGSPEQRTAWARLLARLQEQCHLTEIEARRLRRYCEGESYRAIARAEGVSSMAVQVSIQSALGKAKHGIAREWIDVGLDDPGQLGTE